MNIDDLYSLFWISMGPGVVLAFVLVAILGVIAWFLPDRSIR